MRHLTFQQLHRLTRQGFDIRVDYLTDTPINSPLDQRLGPTTVAAVEYYDFVWYPPHIPGEDRRVTLTFNRNETDAPWTVAFSDRDDDGDPYYEDSQDCQTLDDALAIAQQHPWTPSAARLVTILRKVTGKVTVQDGVLTLPDGTTLPLPDDTTS